jgi:cytosine/uracil/thiamine/allantoin permease
MGVIYKNFIIFILLYFVFVIFDYVENNTFNWTENMIQSLFFVVFFRLLIWLLDGKKNKKILPVFFYINPLV